MKLFAANDPAIDDLFGGISPPAAMNVGGDNPVSGLSKFIGFAINMFIMLAGITLLLYLLWGAFDWISSSGDKEKLTKAQSKITNAVIGMLLVFVVLAVFNLVAGNILHIVDTSGGGFGINLPTLGQ